MKFYPDPDVFFYIDVSDGWDKICRWPQKSWKKQKDLSPTTSISYWRDLEGAKKNEILNADLYFDKWMPTRLRGAFLPIFYAVGHRFIRISKAWPAGFKCALIPLNLIEARAMKAKIKEEEKKAKKSGKKGKKGKKSKGKK